MTTIRADRDPAIDAALRTAAALTGMEVIFISRLDARTLEFEEVHGDLPGVAAGGSIPRADTFCDRMLANSTPATSNAPADPVFAEAAVRNGLAITSYVGVPIHNAAGEVVGTLCGIDRGEVEVDDAIIGVLEELAAIVARHLPGVHSPEIVVRRTTSGWHVDGAPTSKGDNLIDAMTLAELLCEGLALPDRPHRPTGDLDEVGRLQLTVTQLEHALTARVVVEQAIGVLTERLQTSPRAAFERLRKAARSRGRRVHELAREVVESANDRAVPLPPELHGRR